MKLIKQTDKRLNERIQKIGCFFISCADVAQMKTGRELTPEQIEDVWQWAHYASRIDGEDNVKDSASIMNRFLRVLGDTGHFCEVGTFRNGKTQFYPAIREQNRHVDALIQKIAQGGPSKTHFRVVDNAGNVLEDPHEPPIKEQGIFYSILYAYIEG